MSMPLPHSEFRFLSPEECRAFPMDQKRWDLDSSHGHFFTVNLHYPRFLHDSHSDWPIICEKRDIKLELNYKTNKLCMSRLK